MQLMSRVVTHGHTESGVVAGGCGMRGRVLSKAMVERHGVRDSVEGWYGVEDCVERMGRIWGVRNARYESVV